MQPSAAGDCSAAKQLTWRETREQAPQAERREGERELQLAKMSATSKRSQQTDNKREIVLA